MAENKVIDVLNYPFNPEQQKRFWGTPEMKIMIDTLIKSGGPPPHVEGTPEEVIAQMDEAGVDKVMIAAVKMYSWRQRRMGVEYTNEEVYELVKYNPKRIIGLAGYNPFDIDESLKGVEKAVKEYGFKGVYGHFESFGLPANDKKLYPLYAKCVELDVPVSMQIGHAMEVLPSEPGRPIYVDEVALDFPKLKFIISHTGWPWCEEAIAMAWKHANVYLDVSAHNPKYLDKSVIQFMDTRGRDKVMFGTNSWPFKFILDQFYVLPIREETKQKVLRDNAMRVFKL